MNEIMIIVTIVCFAIHSYLSFTLVKRITDVQRFGGKLFYPICILNGLFSPMSLNILGNNESAAYTLLLVVITLEIILLFKGKIFLMFGIASGLLLHLFTIRSVVLGTESLIKGVSIYSIITNFDSLYNNTIVVVCAHILILVLFINLIPPNALKDIIANKTLINFILFLMIVLALFLQFNVRIFSLDIHFIEISVQQILLPLLLLGTFYLMLIFMLRLVMVDKYKKLITELEHKTELDTLTGAYNKDTVQRKVASHLKDNGSGILFVFDLDYFKNINDNMGHAYGDIVLCEIHENIKHLFRSEDIIGRFGGDEFVAFIPGDTSEEVIKKIANRICTTVKKTYIAPDNTEVTISASIGIAKAPTDASNYEELFIAADIAMYESKSKGRNTFTIYDKKKKRKFN